MYLAEAHGGFSYIAVWNNEIKSYKLKDFPLLSYFGFYEGSLLSFYNSFGFTV